MPPKKNARGAGRPKGATGSPFLQVKLKDLNAVLKDEATVMVSRKYCQQLVLDGEEILTQNNAKHLENIKDQLKSGN